MKIIFKNDLVITNDWKSLAKKCGKLVLQRVKKCLLQMITYSST